MKATEVFSVAFSGDQKSQIEMLVQLVSLRGDEGKSVSCLSLAVLMMVAENIYSPLACRYITTMLVSRFTGLSSFYVCL